MTDHPLPDEPLSEHHLSGHLLPGHPRSERALPEHPLPGHPRSEQPLPEAAQPAPRRIALVCDDLDAGVAGTADSVVTHVMALAAALGRRGVQVDLWSPGTAAEPAPGVRVHRTPPPSQPAPAPVGRSRVSADRMAARGTAALLEDARHLGRLLADQWAAEPPDVVHAHGLVAGLACVVARRDVPVPLLATFPQVSAAERRLGLTDQPDDVRRGRLEQAVARDVDGLVVRSVAELADATRMGARRSLTTVVPCGVDLDVFSGEGPTTPAAPHGRIVSLGGLEPRAGVDSVVRALRILPAVELVVTGRRPADPHAPAADSDLARLTALAHACGVADRVRMATDAGPAVLAALLRSADVVVDASWHAPSGHGTLQAMACGRAVVASSVGAHIDLVADGVTGLLVPPQRPDKLAVALRALLGDEFGRQAYGEAGRDRAHSRYGWDRIAGEHLSLYRRALGPTAVDVGHTEDDQDDLELDLRTDAGSGQPGRPPVEGASAREPVDLASAREPVDLASARDGRAGATGVMRLGR